MHSDGQKQESTSIGSRSVLRNLDVQTSSEIMMVKISKQNDVRVVGTVT